LSYLSYSHSGGKTSGVVLRLLTILLISGLTVVAVMGVAGMTGCGGGDPRLERARELEDSGNVEAANTLYRWILRERPDDVDVLRSLAVNLTMAQRFDEALPYLLKTVRLDDQDARTRVDLAFNYLNHQGAPDSAVKWLEEAVEIEGTAKYKTFLAQALLEAGQRGSAVAVLREVVREAPEYGRAQDLLERVKSGAGN